MTNAENQQDVIELIQAKLKLALSYSDLHLAKFKEYEKQAIRLKELLHRMTEKPLEEIV